MSEPQTYPTDDGGAATGHVPSRWLDANADGRPDERPAAVDAAQRSRRTLAQGALAASALAVLVVLTQTIGAAHAEALQFALQRGSRSGRVALQFARDYAGRHRLSQSTSR